MVACRPSGCEGLNRESWLSAVARRPGLVDERGRLPFFTEEGYLDYSSIGTNGNDIVHNRLSDVIPGKRFSGCGLNTDVTESGLKMHEVVEKYASDNDVFLQDFSTVYQKMLQNGYQENNEKGNQELNAGWEWVNMRCRESNRGDTCRVKDNI